MLYLFSVCVYLTFSGFIANVEAAACIPNPVENVNISANKTLTWDASTNCLTDYYTVSITAPGSLQYAYEVNDTSLDVEFLPYCRVYTVSVVAVADHIVGAEAIIEASIGPPPGATIAVSSFEAYSVGYDTLLRWDIDESYELCVEFYRINIFDYDSDYDNNSAVVDEYSEDKNYLLQNTGACARYVINITAVYLDTEGPVTSVTYNVPPANLTAPTLQFVDASASGINTTWTLEPFLLNRCIITSLIVDGTPNFDLTFPIDDSSERLPVYANITGLQPSTLYVFRVIVSNTAGLSAAVPLAVQTDGY